MLAHIPAQCAGRSGLLLRVAGLDVHGLDVSDESQLLFGEFVYQPTHVQQPDMIVRVGRVVVVRRLIVGLQHLLQRLTMSSFAIIVLFYVLWLQRYNFFLKVLSF